MKTIYTACEYCGQVLVEHSGYAGYGHATRQVTPDGRIVYQREPSEPEAIMLRVFGRLFGFCTMSHRDEWLAARSHRFKKPPDEDEGED